ncbi:hypothetical protein HMPREF9057_00480 [Actinomyces sp. oral taxon 171 str. F0337]|nr:hypothetical protein HMPREF9057_00480 [Actinomyces sp. oral taxon 171 str. F0337]
MIGSPSESEGHHHVGIPHRRYIVRLVQLRERLARPSLCECLFLRQVWSAGKSVWWGLG